VLLFTVALGSGVAIAQPKAAEALQIRVEALAVELNKKGVRKEGKEDVRFIFAGWRQE
jgi:hypothetical protein